MFFKKSAPKNQADSWKQQICQLFNTHHFKWKRQREHALGKDRAHHFAGKFSLHRWPLAIHFENRNWLNKCRLPVWYVGALSKGLIVPLPLLPKKIRMKQNNREGSNATRIHSTGLFAKRKLDHRENRNRIGSSGLSQSSAPAFSKFKKPGHYQVHILSRDSLWNTKHSLDRMKDFQEGHRDTEQGERLNSVSTKPLSGRLEREAMGEWEMFKL